MRILKTVFYGKRFFHLKNFFFNLSTQICVLDYECDDDGDDGDVLRFLKQFLNYMQCRYFVFFHEHFLCLLWSHLLNPMHVLNMEAQIKGLPFKINKF